MFGISGAEMLVIMVIVLLVFGPKELPAAMRTAGRALRAINRMRSDVQRQFETVLREVEKETGADEMRKSITDAARDLQKPPVPAKDNNKLPGKNADDTPSGGKA